MVVICYVSTIHSLQTAVDLLSVLCIILSYRHRLQIWPIKESSKCYIIMLKKIKKVGYQNKKNKDMSSIIYEIRRFWIILLFSILK